MMRGLYRIGLAVLAAATVARGAGAQGGGRPLDELVREQLARVMRNQVGLNDAQMQKVQELNVRLDQQRRGLNADESRVRQALRDEVMIGDTTHNQAVGELLDRLVRIQRQRGDLVEQEQRDLAQFMSPMQRARYFGVQEAVRRRVQQLLAEQAPGDSLARPGRGAPPRKRP